MSGLLNYTTEIPAAKTISEIYAMLATSRIAEIRSQYDGFGNVSAISFSVQTSHGIIPFLLPANVKAAGAVLNKQVREKRIPRRYLDDTEQARRVAWRIVRQWVEAQLALVSLEMTKIEEVFFPYAQNSEGRTVFEVFESSKFKGLALPEAAK